MSTFQLSGILRTATQCGGLGLMLLCGGPFLLDVCNGADDQAAERKAVQAAVKKLGELESYSWTATPRSEPGSAVWRQSPTEGSAEKTNYTFLKFTLGDNEIEIAFKGSKSAIKRENTWESSTELTGDSAWIAQRLQAYKAPAAEAAQLLASSGPLKLTNGVYHAELSGDGAKELMVYGRRGATGETLPVGARGTVKFRIQDGLLTRYEFNLQGTLKTTGEEEQVTVNRTTIVEIKNVNQARAEVPEPARRKLD